MTDYYYQSRGSRRAPDDDRRAYEESRDNPYPPEDEAYWAESEAAADAAAEEAAAEALWYEDRVGRAAGRAEAGDPEDRWVDPSEEEAPAYAAPVPSTGRWSGDLVRTGRHENAGEEPYGDEDDDDGAFLPVPAAPRAYVPGGQAAAARAAAASGERNIRFDPTKERGVAYYDAAARHSRNVRLLKLGLPVIAGIAVAGFFLFMTLGEKGDGLPALTLSGIDLDTREITMDKPHISGFDGTKQSYEVTAAKAVQALGNPKVVALETIDADFAVSETVRARLLSVSGVYDANTQKLDLDGGIDITTDNGYTGRLEKAAVDIGAGTVFSDTGVMLRGAEGQITADSLQVLDRGKHIVFRGNVKLHYAPPEETGPAKAKDDAGAAPAAATPESNPSVPDGST